MFFPKSRSFRRLMVDENRTGDVFFKKRIDGSHGAFPTAYSADSTRRPLHSWRVHQLPYLGHKPLFDRFRLDEPWDSDHNLALLSEMPEVYRSPLSPETSKTVYLAIPIDDGVLRRPIRAEFGSNQPTGVRLDDITDGT